MTNKFKVYHEGNITSTQPGIKLIEAQVAEHRWGGLERVGRDAEGVREYASKCDSCNCYDDSDLAGLPCWVVWKYWRP